MLKAADNVQSKRGKKNKIISARMGTPKIILEALHKNFKEHYFEVEYSWVWSIVEMNFNHLEP